MAVDINSLVRTIGGQEKVIDKDKALLELANAIENGGGGGGQTTNIVKCWKDYDGAITEVSKEVGEEEYLLEMSRSATGYFFTTDEQQPDFENFSNIALNVSVNNDYQIEVVIYKPIIMVQEFESGKKQDNNLIPPTGQIVLFEDLIQQTIKLTIRLIYSNEA